jgi:acetylornithine/succinyldiaminopimelate/putrescine aminotransferase
MILDDPTWIWSNRKLFGFQNYDVVPDVVVMGKGMGGGMPVGFYSLIRNDGFIE